MAGTIPLSLTQQLDEFGEPLAGGRLYLIQAGTVSTPQNGFQDSALTLAWPNPIILDAAGRLPQFFLADGSIKVRLTDVNGVEKLVADGIIVTGASSGGGGGSPVDPTTVLGTGDIKVKYGTGVLSGFVRTNGRTLGNATSSATERANADTEALFTFLWNADANLAVSSGRGASAAADYAASKNIVLPDWRGRIIAGLDDMGNTAAGRLTTSYFGSTATVLGASGGFESHTLTLSETPAGITTSGVNLISVANAAQAISVANAAQAISVANAAQAISVSGVNSITASGSNSITASGANSISVTSTTSRVVLNTGTIDSATVAGGTQGVFHDVNAVSMATVTSTNVSQAISVANAAQAISVANAAQNITASGSNSITASGTNSITASGANSITASGSNTVTGTSTNTLGNAHAIVPPMMLATIYIKL